MQYTLVSKRSIISPTGTDDGRPLAKPFNDDLTFNFTGGRFLAKPLGNDMPFNLTGSLRVKCENLQFNTNHHQHWQTKRLIFHLFFQCLTIFLRQNIEQIAKIAFYSLLSLLAFPPLPCFFEDCFNIF